MSKSEGIWTPFEPRPPEKTSFMEAWSNKVRCVATCSNPDCKHLGRPGREFNVYAANVEMKVKQGKPYCPDPDCKRIQANEGDQRRELRRKQKASRKANRKVADK